MYRIRSTVGEDLTREDGTMDTLEKLTVGGAPSYLGH